MFKKLLFMLVLTTLSLNQVFASYSLSMPCYKEMTDFASEYNAAMENKVNLDIIIEIKDDSSNDLKSALLSWVAPKETNTGVTRAFTMVSANGQCILE